MYVGYLPTVGGRLVGKKLMETERDVTRKEKQTDFHESLLETSHLIPPLSFRESVEIRMVPASNLGIRFNTVPLAML